MVRQDWHIKNTEYWNQARFDNSLTKTNAIIENLELSQLQYLDAGFSCDAEIAHAKNLRKYITHLVIIGTGGSSLSGNAITNLVPLSNDLEIIYWHNCDPTTIHYDIERLPLETTHFLVISKSGNTIETMAQFKMMLEIADSNLFTIITENNNNPLKELANQYDITCFDHSTKIGGRYSALTNVGMLPAAISGLDSTKIFDAARNHAINIIKDGTLANNVAHHDILKEKDCNIHVMMPYSDRLKAFNQLYAQIWAESLGKDTIGSTPLTSIGTVDQHSQQQLYLDGPKDKYFSFILVEDYEIKSPLSDIMIASGEAAIETFQEFNRPIRVIKLEKVNEAAIGALLIQIMLETITLGLLWNINPFNQPTVENAKNKTREKLGI